MRSYNKWTDEEWDFCVQCFYRSSNPDEALKLFQKQFPERDKNSVYNRFHKQGIRSLEIIGKHLDDSGKHIPNEVPMVEDRLAIAKLKRHITQLRAELEETKKEIITSRKLLDFVHDFKETTLDTEPVWTQKPKEGVTGTPVLFLSDIHFDEYVDPAQIGGVNSYSRKIATTRIKHTFQTAVDRLLHQMNDPKYEGIVCMLGGDLLSGNIHEELAETNESPVLQSAIDLTELLLQGLIMLADNFGKVFVPCVVGNHGRLHRKPRAKNKVKDNYEWFIYQMLAKSLSNDDRFTFMIPEGSDAIFSIFGKTFLLSHGDQFRGGSGISGIFSPLFIGQARKQKRQQAIQKPFDIMCLGHWHQYIHTESLIVNGSIKGYDEYAYNQNFGYEDPQQALFVVDRDGQITYRMPIQCNGYEKKDKKKIEPLRVW